MKTVWVVSYDWGMYGAGITGVYSTKEKAEEVAKNKSGGYGSYTVEEFTMNEEN